MSHTPRFPTAPDTPPMGDAETGEEENLATIAAWLAPCLATVPGLETYRALRDELRALYVDVHGQRAVAVAIAPRVPTLLPLRVLREDPDQQLLLSALAFCCARCPAVRGEATCPDDPAVRDELAAWALATLNTMMALCLHQHLGYIAEAYQRGGVDRSHVTLTGDEATARRVEVFADLLPRMSAALRALPDPLMTPGTASRQVPVLDDLLPRMSAAMLRATTPPDPRMTPEAQAPSAPGPRRSPTLH